MYNTQLFEMLSTHLHQERLATAERLRVGEGGGQVSRPWSAGPEPMYRRMLSFNFGRRALRAAE